MSDRAWWRVVGPGLAIAATGVGAGDLMAALLAGASHGMTLLWVILVGAALKFALNEGVARWQLATGTTLLEGWFRHLGAPLRYYFIFYLVLWGFLVAGGLMSACGVAAHALFGGLPIWAWAIVHSLGALGLILLGRYELFERVMKVLIGLMVLTLITSAALLAPDLSAIIKGLTIPRLPEGSAASVLGLMGGVGGSVTLLSYGYWIREKGWTGEERLRDCRVDLAIGYALTGLFGLAMLVLAATVFGAESELPGGSRGLITCADAIASATTARWNAEAGQVLHTVFLIGVWSAIFTSTLGVWQGVPYLFADTYDAWRGRFGTRVDVRGRAYRSSLLYLAIPPMLLLYLGRPIWIIKLYTLASGLFMPLLAGSLLWMNRRKIGKLENGPVMHAALVPALVLFGVILGRQIADSLVR